MRSHLIGKSRLTAHLLLGSVLVVCAVVLAHAPSVWRTVASVVGATFAAHAGLAIAIHAGLALAAGGVLFTAIQAHGQRQRGNDAKPGATLHSPRFYDWLAAVWCFGREGRMRECTLEIAGVGAGDHLLDVCCGTGTLALAAKRRVGATGSVYGIDASEEMIARARAKGARSGSPVTFEIATAQSLPFPEATFDVVVCSLALHHLSEEGRAAAVAEMRRVVKPGGRVRVVEFQKRRGLWAVVHPVALLHAWKSRQILEGAVDLMRGAGLGGVITAPLGFGGLAYALARRA